MDIAKCTIDGKTYLAVNFAKLPVDELTEKRRNLVCTSCGSDAYFRKESKSGQAACFGATPHNEGCELAAPDSTREEGDSDIEDIQNNPGQVIEIDLNFGATPKTNIDINPDDNDTGTQGKGRHVGQGTRPNAHSHRRLSSLLRNLIRSKDFRNSKQIINIEEVNSPVRDFFVKFSGVVKKYEYEFQGYWGALADAQQDSYGNLWLNSGGRSSVSVLIESELVQSFYKRFKLEDEEALAGAGVLVLGTMYISERGKKFIKPKGLDYLTVKKA